jgi:hypothetical protein
MREGLKLYFEHKILTGGFLTAVLSNDLLTAASKADDINKYKLHDYCTWLYNHAPMGSYGSPEAVKQWLGR